MRTTRIGALIVLFLSVSYTAKTQTPCIYLAEDILVGSAYANPTQFTEYAGDVYFSADDGVVGIELWKWDGTDATLVEDIRPGFFSSAPKGFYVWSGDLYFSANDGTNGTELFRYDGSTVTLVADINPGAFHSFPNNFIEFPGGLYFTADNGVNGTELYRYDGSSASLIWDCNPGPGGSNILEFEVFGTELIFAADDGVNGKEPWAYDGTTAAMLMDVRPGFASSACENFTNFDGEVVFRADDGSTGMELWAYDGASTYQIMDINPGFSNGNPWYIVTSGGYLYFRALDGVWGMELWRYDGSGLPYLLEDIYPGGPHPISSAPSYLADIDGILYFQANDGVGGYEIYRHDHTTLTSYDLNPGSGNSDPQRFTGNGLGDVFFTATDGAVGTEIWKWDGSSPPLLGEDLMPGAAGSGPNDLFFYAPSDILFNAEDGVVGAELWDWPFDIDVGSEISEVSCGDYTAPSGTVYTTPGSYTVMDTIPSVAYPLCDSVITINLTIANDDPAFNYSSTDFCTNDIDEVPTVADPGGLFSVTPSGLIFSPSTGELFFNISTPGSYTIKYVTGGACSDSSEVTINLQPANDASFSYENATYCLSDNDPWPQAVVTAGGVWSSTPVGMSIDAGTGIINLGTSTAGSYTVKYVTGGVCPDSTTFPITLVDLTTDITVTGNVLTAIETGATYQWMKCDPTFGLLPIWEGNSISYIPPTDGCYAVELIAGTCIDTSDCECLIFYGLEENQLPINVSLYPNPTSDYVSVLVDLQLDAELYVTDEIGRIMYHETFSGYKTEIDLSHLAPGVYLFMLTNKDGAFIEKLVKE